MNGVFRGLTKQDVISTGLTITDLGGITVVNGVDGTKWHAEQRDPTMSDGKVGDFFFNLADRLIYGPKRVGGWDLLINFGAAEVDMNAIIAASIAYYDANFPGWRDSGGTPGPANILPATLPFIL